MIVAVPRAIKSILMYLGIKRNVKLAGQKTLQVAMDNEPKINGYLLMALASHRLRDVSLFPYPLLDQ